MISNLLEMLLGFKQTLFIYVFVVIDVDAYGTVGRTPYPCYGWECQFEESMVRKESFRL